MTTPPRLHAVPASLPMHVVDEGVVRELQQRVDARLEHAARTDRATEQELSRAQERARTEALVAEEIEHWLVQRATAGAPALSREQEQQLANAVLAALAGLGRLDVLLRREDVENIFLFGHDRVFLELFDGTIQQWPYPVADSDPHLITLLAGMFARLGQTSREFSAGSPIGNLRLPAGGTLGARLAAVMEVTDRPHVAIRRHRLMNATLDDLHARGTLDRDLHQFLRAAVRAGCRIGVSGEWGSGKTTLLRALCHEADPSEHLITIEDDQELGLAAFPQWHPMVTAMEARLPNAEGVGGIDLDDLLKQALRHSPRRVIVGEVRGGEVAALLRALSTGAGGMCTLHATSGHAVFDRIANMAALAIPPLEVCTAYRWIATALDLIVHVERHDYTDPTGRRVRNRFVSQVLEVGSIGDSGRPDYTELFGLRPGDGRAVPLYPPSPRLQHTLGSHGLDFTMFDHTTDIGEVAR